MQKSLRCKDSRLGFGIPILFGISVAGEWPLHFCSVIVFGRIAPVTDAALTETACRRLAEKFTDDAAYIDAEIAAARDRVLCLALTPEHMTGKRIKES